MEETERRRSKESIIYLFFVAIMQTHVHCQQNEQQFVTKDVEAKGFNPGLIVLLVVGGILITFLVGNYVLYMYAQKTLPRRKKKPVSKKKLKREKLKQGVSVPGE